MVKFSQAVSDTALNVCAGRGASSGVGFAIPIDTVTGLVEQILKFGRVVRPVLGITIAPPQTIRQLNVEGILILDIPAGSPADLAGLKGTSRYVTLLLQACASYALPAPCWVPPHHGGSAACQVVRLFKQEGGGRRGGET